MRPEIQGLRAVAVGLVLLYHLWPNRLTGGYVGVDVFFVISGFLITAHLLRELTSTGTIRLGAFWARRARRLLPAALLVLLLTAGATEIWVPIMNSDQFFREIGAAGLYVQNWVLAADSVDYLAAENAPSPVQHYWSLSVEEQFYLVWPVLIVLAVGLCAVLARHHRAGTAPAGGVDLRQWRAIGGTLIAVTVGSLLVSAWLTARNPPLAYFVTPTRAWEFGAGALLAYLQTHASPHRTRAGIGWHATARLRGITSWLGLLAIAVSAVTYTGSTPFPGTAALLPVLGTVAIIWAGDVPKAWAASVLLRLRPACFVGDISYSLYLWHWPLIAIMPYVLGHPTGRTARLSILIASVLLAWASKVWVEDPVRTARVHLLRRTGVTLGTTALSMALVAGVSGSAWANVHHEQVEKMAEAAAAAAHRPRCLGAPSIDPDRADCPNQKVESMLVPDPDVAELDLEDPQCFAKFQAAHLLMCSFGAGSGVPKVALVGDSHARMLMSGLLPLARQGLLQLDTYLKAGCPWTSARRDLAEEFVDNCVQWNDELGAALLHRGYDAVITSAFRKLKMQVPDGSDQNQTRVRGLVEAWAPVSKAGIPIIAVKDNPSYGVDPNPCLHEHQPDRKAMLNQCSKPRKVALRGTDPQVAAVRQTASAHLIDFDDLFCTHSRCPAIIGGVDVYRDDHHVTATYWQSLTPYLRAELRTYGVLPNR